MKKEIAQRKYDGKWVMWGLIPDPEFVFVENSEMPIPMKWVPLKVYDYEVTLSMS